MSHNTNERMFWFRGSTMALGGRIVSPVCENIDAQAASVLPPTGGFAAASVGEFNYKNIIRFDRATSTVSGQKVEHGKNAIGETNKTGDTLVTVAIEGLNILDVITADRVVARMTSSHAIDTSEPGAVPFGSYFENLRIGGIPIKLRPYRELVCEGTYQALTAPPHCANSFPFIDVNGMSKPLPAERDKVLMAPLFNVDRGRAAAVVGSTKSGVHGIRIPGFGTVYFGEYLITRASRRLTMLRVELGCPITGSIVCANVDTNGHWDP
jgi:hypothetical protein